MDIDKKLVQDTELTFIKENLTKTMLLNDDGVVELYEDNKLIESKPFSKITVERDYKKILQDGYTLQEDLEPKTEVDQENIDLDQTEQELKDDIEQVDRAQELKDELETKLDKLYNESRVNRKLHRGDKFVNPNGVECTIISVDEENLLDGEPQVTYQIGKDYKCYKQSSVNSMLDQNKYTLQEDLDNSIKTENTEQIPGTEVKKVLDKNEIMPSSTLTSKKLTKQEILDMNQVPVSNKQMEFLFAHDIGEEDIILGLQDVVKQMKYLQKDKPFISIEEYVNEVINN